MTIFKEKRNEAFRLLRLRISVACVAQHFGVSRPTANYADNVKNESEEVLSLLDTDWLILRDLADVYLKPQSGSKKERDRRFSPSEVHEHMMYIAQSESPRTALKNWASNGYRLSDGEPDCTPSGMLSIRSIVNMLKYRTNKRAKLLVTGLDKGDYLAVLASLGMKKTKT